MFSLLSPLFSAARTSPAKGCSPIGVDLGADSLRMIQLADIATAPRLVAAASRDVPTFAAADANAYAEFAGEAMREMIRECDFSGRRATLGLPAHQQHWLHVRLPKHDAGQMAEALQFACAGKLPFDPLAAVLRHHVVGDVYTEEGPRQEVLCTAARRSDVEKLLACAEQARLDVSGITASPTALCDGFSRVYRRASDAETGWCFVDIGQSSTRIVIARAGHVYFARAIPVGGTHLNKAVAAAVGVSDDEAKLMRMHADDTLEDPLAKPQADEDVTGRREEDHSFALLGAATRAGETHQAERQLAATSVGQAEAAVLDTLADEIDRCRRYHEAAFANVPVQRLAFIGGESRRKSTCMRIARRLSLAAQIGDLMPRLLGNGMPASAAAAGIVPGEPQPSWSLATCLAMPPVKGSGLQPAQHAAAHAA